MTSGPKFDSSSLEEAVRHTLAGNTDAFEAIVRRLEGPLRTWLAGHAPPGIDVDEIAQQSFIDAFGRLNDYQPGTNFPAWLFTIARYKLKTETTRLRRVADYHARYAPDLLRQELQRRIEEPPEMMQDRFRHLRACLDALADHLRCFVAWRYDEEIPLEEMATRSGRSVAAVKKQLWLIRQKLQKCIEQRMAVTGGEPA